MSYFENVPKVRYEGKASKNRFAFKFYNPEQLVLGKSMRETLKFAMAYWHTLCADGTDPFGSATIDRSYSRGTAMDGARAKADAGFEFMDKLDIDYFCFHDVDMAPAGECLGELKENLAEISDYVKLLMAQRGKKLLWGTANCFSHPRYMHGAATSPYADSFAAAACQIKNAIDTTIKLGGTGYVFWGGREGYDTLLNTDMGFELDNLARMLTMARDYGRAKGFRGDFYIEPKPKEPTKHQYDFDCATAIGFLNKYGLSADFKMNVENNHATLAGHTFQHELNVARVNGMFGSVDANQGESILGWDVDRFPCDVYETAMCMYEIVKAGGFTNGGLNFDAKVRRSSFMPQDIAQAFILGMDAYALGLLTAEKLIQDGRLEQFVAQRYSSYQSGIGQKIVSGNTSLEELERYALDNKAGPIKSGGQEYLESVINSVMFGA